MTSLSIMFETFVWFLGDEPYLHLNKNSDDFIEMDVVGKSCMRADDLIKPTRNKVKVKMMTPELVCDFEIRSHTNLKVEDFVRTVNAQATAVLDVVNKDILVSNIIINHDMIVLMSVFHDIKTN